MSNRRMSVQLFGGDSGAPKALSYHLAAQVHGDLLREPVLQPGRNEGQRGLLFVAYQASIESQFEFLMTDWADSPLNPRSYFSGQEEHPAGHDPIIGQQPVNGRQRSFTLRIDAHTFETITLPSNFVIATGGGYFFAPSITALHTVLAK